MFIFILLGRVAVTVLSCAGEEKMGMPHIYFYK